jgi:serine phosphatase RsbU (regulator of sigma subunit)
MGQLPLGQFVTVLLAIVDVASAKVVISSAGHPPLVVCGEKARFLEVPPGTPLGAVTSVYAEAEFELLPTETMVLYTDGLIEARRGIDFFGEQRLIEALGEGSCANVQQMVESLVSKVTEHAGGRLADDLAVIAVHLV